MVIFLLSRHKSNIISLAWLLIVVLSISNMIMFANCIKNAVQLEADLTLRFASLYEKLATMEMPYG
jgi:hypothetical protein